MRHINKTDVVTLGSTFGVSLLFDFYVSFSTYGFFFTKFKVEGFFFTKFKVEQLQSLSNIMDASMEDLARCPGIGERKVCIILMLS